MRIRILLIITFSLLFGGLFSLPAFAQDDPKPNVPSFDAPDLKVSIPGLERLKSVQCEGSGTCSIPWLAQYIASLQRYAIGAIGILAAVVMMIGGIVWLTSGGNSSRVGQAQKMISGGLLGLILTFGSYVILYTINPDLTALKSLRVKSIDKIDLEELLYIINSTDSLTSDQASILDSLDTQGLIKHTAGASKNAYKSMSCNKSMFAGGKSVEFYTTGYYKPGPWENSKKFFCSVGLNCSCPVGKHIRDSSCNNNNNQRCPYFDSTVKYCNRNAAGVDPVMGTIAADLSCFKTGDKVCLGGKLTLTVADAGSAIKGRRFDIWNGFDYKGALASTGLAQITLGPCN